MGAVFLRKYNTLLVTGTTAIRIPIIKRAVVDFAVSGDWTPSAGDVKVWIDGTPGNITNLPTAVNSGNCTFWEFILTAAELSAKQVIVVVTDSATKAVEDTAFLVETYGNASAMYAADLSLANLPANVTQLLGTAWLTPGVAGTPDVNAKQAGGQTLSAAGTVTLPATVASTTNITAGTITTVTNLTNAPTNGDLTATMKASVNTEADTALADYDAPTNAEMVARTLAAASYATATALATAQSAIDAVGVIVTAISATIGAAGAGLTAIWTMATRTITGFTTAGKAEVQQEVQDAITASGLDTMATRFATMIVVDGAVYQFTANALELGPSGGGGGAGTGARTVVITVNDGADELENANVRVTQGAETYVQATDVDGEVTFNLDDATWTVAITKPGYLFAGASLVVNGTEAQTYSMTLVAITPSDPGATTGYVTIRTSSGDPIEGAVVQVQVMKFANGTTGSGIDNPLAEGTTDSNGYVEFVGLPRLATYRVRVGTTGLWFTGVTLDAASTPLAGVLGRAE